MHDAFVEWFGGVRQGSGGALAFPGVNVPLLRNMQRRARAFAARQTEYPVFPLERLTSFEDHRDAGAWGAKRWKIDADEAAWLYYEQGYAFVRFLDDAEDGRRRDDVLKILGALLDDEVSFRSYKARRELGKLLGVETAAQWSALDEAFAGYLRSRLLTMDLPRASR